MRLLRGFAFAFGAFVLLIATVLVLSMMARGVTNAWGRAYIVDDRAQLPKADAILVLLVSGIKIGGDYDEAAIMRDELVARGIPASAIKADHKGNRTWDSVYRARHVYGKRRLIIVSQRDHLPRAIFHRGLGRRRGRRYLCRPLCQYGG
jgi:vancomycin permeability regulator SanA